MSDLEQSVFRVVKRHPFCSVVLVAYKLGLSQVEVQVAMERLAERGIIPEYQRSPRYTTSAASV